ncbi:MAG: FAD-binding protein [Nanoarchaeota archaeon]|nr:FAD-binding protein [Nanoarchaeota archaeon]
MKGGAFGFIPIERTTGGYALLKKLLASNNQILTKTSLIDFQKVNDRFLISLQGEKEHVLSVKKLVLATGGYGGKFECTDNFRYSSYVIQDLVIKNGGNVKNKDSIFIHPFGYNKGKKILIGIESMAGEFLDSKDEFLFEERLRKMIKENNYHESFSEILERVNRITSKGEKIYFVDSKRKLEIKPTVHYTGGGIDADEFGRVYGIEGLFAIGECRADGSRNGGRLPGYAFTSAIVDGKNIASILARELYSA